MAARVVGLALVLLGACARAHERQDTPATTSSTTPSITTATTTQTPTVLNFTIVDAVCKAPPVVAQQALGYHLAVSDAQQGLFGLFPQDDVVVAAVDRVLLLGCPDELALAGAVLAAVREDKPVGVMGGLTIGSSKIIASLTPSTLPKVSASLAKFSVGHRPRPAPSSFFGAAVDVDTGVRGVRALLADMGFSTVVILFTGDSEVAPLGRRLATALRAVGVGVGATVVMEDGGEAGAVAQIAAQDARAVVVLSNARTLQAVLEAANGHGMLGGGSWVWVHWFGYLVDVALRTSPVLPSLVSSAHVLAITPPVVDTARADVQALVQRAQDLPQFPSTLSFNVGASGLTRPIAAAYDSGIALLAAVNRTLAKGHSPYNHTAVLRELQNTDMLGLQGRLRGIEGSLGFLQDFVFTQYTPANATLSALGQATAGDVVSTAVRGFDGTCNALAALAPLRWGTSDGKVPPNFAPLSCGSLLFRTAHGECVACPAGTLNAGSVAVAAGDGGFNQSTHAEHCAFCTEGHELRGGACAACDDDQDFVWLATGEPHCNQRPDAGDKGAASQDVRVLAGIVGACVGGLWLLGCAGVGAGRVARVEADARLAVMKAKEAQFLAFSFHELRNPLNVVSNALDFACATLRDEGRRMRGKAGAERGEEGGKGGSGSSGGGGGEVGIRRHNGQALRGARSDLQCGQQSLADTVHVLDTIHMLSQIIHGVGTLNLQPTCVHSLLQEVVDTARAVGGGAVARTDVRVHMRVRVNGQELAAKDTGQQQRQRSGCGEGAEGEGARERDEAATGGELWMALDKQKMRHALFVLVLNAIHCTQEGSVVVEVEATTLSHTVVQVSSPTQAATTQQPSPPPPPPPPPPAATAGSRRPFRATRLDRVRSHVLAVRRGEEPPQAAEVVVSMSVQDTGPGIPPEDLDHVFDLDYQTKRGSVRSTGLGLVLAHRIVDLHGGRLRVTSRYRGGSPHGKEGEAGGSRFSWTLRSRLVPEGRRVGGSAGSRQHMGLPPSQGEDDRVHGSAQVSGIVVHPPTPSLPAQRQQQQPQGLLRGGTARTHSSSSNDNGGELAQGMPHGLRVLLMEDVALNRKFMQRKLTKPPFDGLGWRIDEVETGEQCLDRVINQGQRFDVIFCDQILSNAGGKLLGSEVAQRLRAFEADRGLDRTVLIACSGNASDEDRKVYAEAGMDGVLPKPLPAQNALLAFLFPHLAHLGGE